MTGTTECGHAILGGGLTGLTIGYLLCKRNTPCRILEEKRHVGGLLRSVEDNGFTFDTGGSHVIFSKDKEAVDLMLEVLGRNCVRRKRDSRVYYRGSFIKYPFENDLASLTRLENYECLESYVSSLLHRSRNRVRRARNLKEWCHQTFGSGISEKYLIPYNEKIWKRPCESLGTEWVDRIPSPPFRDVIKSSLGIPTEGYTHQLHFYYPAFGGIQALANALEHGVSDHIINGYPIRRIRKEDNIWVVSNGRKDVVCSRVVSTIPLQILTDALHAPGIVRNSAKKLTYNSLAVVMLGFKKKSPKAYSWVYLPEQSCLSHRVSFPSNFSGHVAPKGCSSALAEITFKRNDRVSRMKDAEIADEEVCNLHRMGLINREDLISVKVVKTEYAYVVNDMDYAKNLRRVSRYVSRLGISTVGRFSEYKYLNMDACVRHAIDYSNSMENLES